MKFVWIIMPKTEGDADKAKEKPTGGAQAAEAAPGRLKLSEIGADMKPFIEGFEKMDPKAKQDFIKRAQDWDKAENVDEIRRGGVTAAENEKDPLKKHELLAAAFLERDQKANTKMSFKVDFKGNNLAERRVGAGDILPVTAKTIRVQYADGRIIERAVRSIDPATGRIGYYDADLLKQGKYKYVSVFSGSTIDVLETQTAESFEVQRRRFAENMEIYNPPKRNTYTSFNAGGGAPGPVGEGVVSRMMGPRIGDSNPVPRYTPSAAPSFQFNAPTAGMKSIEGRNYQAVDQNFWYATVGRTPQEAARFITSVDPITNEPLSFLGAKIPDGMNVLIIPYLKEAERRIKERGIEYHVHTATCTCWRKVRGSETTQSNHSWGVALDVNPQDNGLGQNWNSLDPSKRVPIEIVEIMESLGFRWGGRWTGRPDPMHFEFSINPLTSTALLTSPEAKRYADLLLPKQGQKKEALAQGPSKAPSSLQLPESQGMNAKLNINIRSKLEPFKSIIAQASEKYGVPQNLIMAVIWQESGGNPNIASHAGAGGLMQLMPFIRDENGDKPPTYPTIARGKGYILDERDWRNDPEKVIMAGTKMLSGLLQKYNGNVVLALAAYNAGSGRVDRAGGVPNIPETQQYVANIPRFYNSLNAEDQGQAPGGSPNKAVA